jgi:hypothetical protein
MGDASMGTINHKNNQSHYMYPIFLSLIHCNLVSVYFEGMLDRQDHLQKSFLVIGLDLQTANPVF